MLLFVYIVLFFFFIDPATTEIYTLSLHDALPIWATVMRPARRMMSTRFIFASHSPLKRTSRCSGSVRRILRFVRSEEHTSELQSRFDLVCRLLLEKKKKNI